MPDAAAQRANLICSNAITATAAQSQHNLPQQSAFSVLRGLICTEISKLWNFLVLRINRLAFMGPAVETAPLEDKQELETCFLKLHCVVAKRLVLTIDYLSTWNVHPGTGRVDSTGCIPHRKIPFVDANNGRHSYRSSPHQRLHNERWSIISRCAQA